MGTEEGLHSGPRPQSQWPESRLGKGTIRVPMHLGAALVLLLAGEGLETKKQFHSLSSFSYPEHV